MKVSWCIALAVLVTLLAVAVVATGEQTPSCTIWVQPGQSVQAAIDSAPEGAVICLSAGTWDENIKIEKSLTLLGAGQDKTTITSKEGGYPVIWIISPEGATQAASVRVQRVGLTGAHGKCGAGNTTNNYICGSGLAIQASHVVVYDSAISNDLIGVVAVGSGQVAISGSIISDNDLGMVLSGSSHGTVIDSSISDNRKAGIMINDQAEAKISDCRIFENKISGIALANKAQGTVSSSAILWNGLGVALVQSACATIDNDRIVGNKCGILSTSSGEVEGDKNQMQNGIDLVGNLHGGLRIPLVQATEQEITYPDPRYSSLQEALDALLPGGHLILNAGEYEAAGTIAKELVISAVEGAKVKFKTDEVPVLSLIRGGKLTLIGINVTGGGDGLILGADARATILDCMLSYNPGYGIELLDTSRATISDSTVSENGRTGVALMGLGHAEISNSTISGNALAGIALKDLAQAKITDSTISENKWDGINLRDSAQAEITDSTISENKWDGVALHNSAQATIEGNKIINNGVYGIMLYQQPCVNADHGFTGHVSGRANTIWDNSIDVCPLELGFLTTEEGGEYGGR